MDQQFWNIVAGVAAVSLMSSVIVAFILVKFLRSHEMSKYDIITYKLDRAAENALNAADSVARKLTDAAESVASKLAAQNDAVALRLSAQNELVQAQNHVLINSSERQEAATAIVASDLALAHARADEADHGQSGGAADAFSKSAP